MKKAAKQVIISALLLLILCLVCRVFFYRTYTVYFPMADAPEVLPSVRVYSDDPEIAAVADLRVGDNYLIIPVIPGTAGSTTLIIENENKPTSIIPLRVSRFRTVVNATTKGFSGDTAVVTASCLFWFLTAAIMFWNFFQTKGPSFYQHYTIWFAGFGLFSLVAAFCLLEALLRHLVDPGAWSMLYIYSILSGASTRFLLLTSPLFVGFAVMMAVSNIALLRHEHPRPQNLLGILISVLLVLGIFLGLYINMQDFQGSEWEHRVRSTLENTYATVFVYFECMLAGSVICGIRAAKHKPAQDKDVILILGCWFRRDGSLPPLLRGRVDRALEFWRGQKEATGREACFIPSGGQGPDEPMPEAEAMRRYLLSKDVPERLIHPETKSRNTFENMSFSREIVRDVAPEGKVLFATTNYHVFRSGVWASMAGLPAEGIGSRTKWWYWPNAFMRETAGLLQKRWKQEIFLLIFLLIYFALLSITVG